MTITAPPETTTVENIIDGEERPCAGETLEKLAPAGGEVLSLLAGSRAGDEIAAVVFAETGESPKDAKGEKDGVIEVGYLIAGEAELPRVLEAVA
jgi:hypothetical protein